MAATIGLVLDCADPVALARFWSEALGYTTVGEAGNYVMLVDEDGVRPKLLLQAVPEVKATKNRMHLDVHVPDIEGEAARLESLGARRLERDARTEFGTNWVIMADPEGNEFCLCHSEADASTSSPA
jgi:predicted enzyme related to lactoylglutathione lyase